MRLIFFLFACLFYSFMAVAQSLPQKLATAVQQFEADAQMKYAIFSLYVADAKTGKLVYEHNSHVGLAPASTQKLFTSAAAFELLGQGYRYKTSLGYNGKIEKGVLTGDLHIDGSSDPTFGSWRWKETRDTVILKNFVAAVKRAGIANIDGTITTNESLFSRQAIPDGWIWQDIGNYYGAGAYVLNWKENQYDLHLRSGSSIGDSVVIVETGGDNGKRRFVNELSSAAKGSGDNAYIYLSASGERYPLVRGTIPVNEKSFSISGAMTDPVTEVMLDLAFSLEGASIHSVPSSAPEKEIYSDDKKQPGEIQVLSTHLSPPLDSINYWFLRRSINLYGEALVKTLASQKGEKGVTTEQGVELVRNFWQQQGIDKAAIHIMDGSGLSPQNRVTTRSLVQVLQYAKTRPWYASFYNCLPEYNGMKMKSGSVGGARAFAGYHTANDGREYSYAIIVNNYDGSAGEAVKKMYRVLDVLK